MKTATVRARIEPELKADVGAVLATLGLSFSEAIELFLHQIKLNKGIPFELRVPNEVTLNTFRATDQHQQLTQHANADEMFKELGITRVSSNNDNAV